MEKYNDYVSKRTALALKHFANFDWATSTYYQGNTSNELINTYPSFCNFNGKDSYYNTHEDVSMHRTSAPTLYVAQKWLREVKGIHITINPCSQEKWHYRITHKGQELENSIFVGEFDTYEEALDEAILIAINDFFLKESLQRKGRQ